MKKRKTAAFLAALMVCAWVPQAVPGDIGVLVAEAHSGVQTGTAATGTIKTRAGLGSYHYHCGGHPAHLHENGVCPYASYVEEAAPAASAEETAAEVPENLSMVFDPIYYADQQPGPLRGLWYEYGPAPGALLTCGMRKAGPAARISMWQYIKNRMQTWRRPTEMIWQPTIPIIWLRPRRGARLPLRGKK